MHEEAEIRTRAMPELSFEEFLRGVLAGEIPAIPKLGDTPRLVLRRYPPQVSDPRHPQYSEWMKWQAAFIRLADLKPSVREGIRNYIRELQEKGEPVPLLFRDWAVAEFAKGEPAPRRGRKEDVDRDFRVYNVYTVLWRHGFSWGAAIDYIAKLTVNEPETIRSILRKFTGTRSRR